MCNTCDFKSLCQYTKSLKIILSPSGINKPRTVHSHSVKKGVWWWGTHAICMPVWAPSFLIFPLFTLFLFLHPSPSASVSVQLICRRDLTNPNLRQCAPEFWCRPTCHCWFKARGADETDSETHKHADTHTHTLRNSGRVTNNEVERQAERKKDG